MKGPKITLGFTSPAHKGGVVGSAFLCQQGHLQASSSPQPASQPSQVLPANGFILFFNRQSLFEPRLPELGHEEIPQLPHGS